MIASNTTSTGRTLVLHEDAFYAFFEPYRHPEATHSSWGGLGLEPWGTDMEIVQRVGWDHAWTVLDEGGADQWIGPGIHVVNRICYLVTRIPHGDLPVEFRAPLRGPGLTARGLSRQLTRLRAHRQLWQPGHRDLASHRRDPGGPH